MNKAKKVTGQRRASARTAAKKAKTAALRAASHKATVRKAPAVRKAAQKGRNAATDPTTVATVWHSMPTICREMRHVIDRTAQNFLISQLHDISVGLWDAKGTT